MAILLHPLIWPLRHPSRQRRVRPVVAASCVRKEDIVIVGAGISGLATAVALQRVGIESVVVEQAESLRSGGTSLTFFKNGWKVFDAIGVAAELRPQFIEIEEMVVKSEGGRELRSFRFKDEDQSQEVRAVERGTLLEALANRLPPTAISFSSKLKSIERSYNNDTLLTLDDDSLISAKVRLLSPVMGYGLQWPSGWAFLIPDTSAIVLSAAWESTPTASHSSHE